MAAGFQDWLQRRPEWQGVTVQIEWRDIGGGTSQIMRYLDAQYQITPDSVGIDLMYGGGTDIYLDLKAKGFLEPYRMPVALRMKLRQNLAGIDFYDGDGFWRAAALDGLLTILNPTGSGPRLGALGVAAHPAYWHGAMLSSLGILYNRDVLELRGITDWQPPDSWSDLGDERLAGWISAGDPRMSGAVHMLYEWILQAYGWEDGMRLLMRLGANARGFARFSDSVSRDVVLGKAIAGGTLDSYGFSAITREQGFVDEGKLARNPLAMVLPKGETILNPDSIAILKGAPHRRLAELFVEYNLSEDGGQQLWMLRPNAIAPDGRRYPGCPRRYNICRLALLEDLYDPVKYPMSVRSVQINPFDEEILGLTRQRAMRYDNRLADSRRRALDDLFGAWIIDTHDDLKAAWLAVLASPIDQRTRLEKQLFAPPCGEEELKQLRGTITDPRQRSLVVSRWQEGARQRYRSIRMEAEK